MRTLDELRTVTNDEELIAAAAAYIAAGEAKLREARKLRNDAVRRLVVEHGPTRVARLTGMTLANVKAIRGTT